MATQGQDGTLDARRDVWSRYWATGALHSCGGSYDGDYGGSIGAFWREAFAALPDDTRVLDVCSGNGALAHLLLAANVSPSVTCDAADIAHLAPPWVDALDAEQRARLAFHGGVAAESLPFEDGRFRLVASQYGLEYTDLDRSVSELLRVLRPDGGVRLVLHHAGSRPVHLAGAEIAHIDELLARDGFFDAAAAMVAPMALSASADGRAALRHDAAAQATRQRFDRAIAAVDAAAAASRCPDVLHDARRWAAQVFNVAVNEGPARAHAALAAVTATLRDARVRLSELRACALDAGALARLALRFECGGLRVRHEVLREAEHVMAWALRADR